MLSCDNFLLLLRVETFEFMPTDPFMPTLPFMLLNCIRPEALPRVEHGVAGTDGTGGLKLNIIIMLLTFL